MSLVMCNVGSSAPRRNNSNEHSSFQSNPSSSGGMPRNSTAGSISMPTSSSTSALHRSAGLHTSQSSSILNQTNAANDKNNNAKAKQAQASTGTDDANQVTIYR